MDSTVMLGHGSGGTMMKRIIDDVFFAAYAGDELLRGDDAAVLPAPAPGERLAFSTDSFVVTPHFFPGGDIGRLAVCGTVNDVATSGAVPRYLSCGFVLEEGFPRNDILARPHPELEEKVRRTLGLPGEKRLLLYAPTFRKDKGLEAYDMDYARCVKALERRFGGEWLILAKLHPNIAEKASQLDLDPRYIVNASGYPDIQELYLACDGLVTDYSSVMFDYLITGKPCFLYVNDLAAYKADRNFTFDIDKLPFPRAEDNGQLEAILLGYDAQEQARRMEAFNREFGLRETGAAARRTVDYLEERRKKG